MMFNFEGKTGAIGRLPWFIENRFPVALVQFDVEKEQPVRNAEGFCIKCDVDEIGEAIGKIVNDPEKPSNRFEGYARAEESEKKILRNVFARDDAWFRTGDLMRKDANGYFFFADRIGDTFRWKGENVSTTEVTEAINTFPGIKDANVYGVGVPGNEGRAGMAVIVCEKRMRPAAALRASRRSSAGLRAARCSCASARTSRPPRPSSRRRSISWRRASIPRAFPIRFISATGPCAPSCRSTRLLYERIRTGQIRL